MNPDKPSSSSVSSRVLVLSCALALLAALAACDKKNDDQTVGQKLDAAVVKAEQAAADAKAKAKAELSLGKINAP